MIFELSLHKYKTLRLLRYDIYYLYLIYKKMCEFEFQKSLTNIILWTILVETKTTWCSVFQCILVTEHPFS